MDKTKLGESPEEHQGRDAVHIAVMPVTAAHNMRPGAHVGLDKNGEASEAASPLIGIIDPYFGTGMLDMLRQLGVDTAIAKGARHWLLLYPNTITSLSHVWSHPVVDDVAPKSEPVALGKAASVAWLEGYVARTCPYYMPGEYHDQPTLHDAYLLFMQRVAEGEIFHSGSDLHSAGDLDDPEELFGHLSVVLGRKVGVDDFSYSCSC